jgi:hypothetical protein
MLEAGTLRANFKGDSMGLDVCENCYGVLKEGHQCGPRLLARDDICPKCRIVVEESAKAVFHYARDMLQIDRIIRDEVGLPTGIAVIQVRALLDKRERRLLKEMESGKIKRS